MKSSRFFPKLALALLPLSAFAETSDQQQARVERLEHAVLAPCCYTESVAVHQSEIAVKMRLEIAKWVAAGKSDQEILDTYSGLYGAKVLVDPRTMPRGWMPFVPWLVAVLGVFFVVWLLKQWRLPAATPEAVTLDIEAQNLPDFEDD
jgi:cytochrome c-type biogenesis protein CcmH/NrfF